MSIGVILLVHVGMLVYSAAIHSPTFQEVSVLPAGVYHWKSGDFSHFRVNPPLIRLIAALPVLAMRPAQDWHQVQDHIWLRNEVEVGADFIHINRESSPRMFFIARCACIPFSVLGALVCYSWSKSLFGVAAGMCALLLWCFCPNILGHAGLISGDGQTAALGVLACFSFREWLRKRTWSNAVLCGIACGLAITAKSTLLILIPVFIAIWIIDRVWAGTRGPRLRNDLSQLCIAAALSYWMLLSIYGFQNCFIRLGDYQFVSRLLAGSSVDQQAISWSNRFQSGMLGQLPVPLPEDYVLGIDRQKRDFEIARPSYALGAWRTSGVWWYYLLGLLTKTPISTLMLLSLAIARLSRKPPKWTLSDWLMLFVPPLVVLLLVSSQTGLNEHFRYVFPVLPFVFIIASGGVLRTRGRDGWRVSFVGSGLLIASIAASISSFPHSIAYFNYSARLLGHDSPILLGSAVDWGQDILLIKRMYQAHLAPERLLYAHVSGYDPNDLGLPCLPIGYEPDWWTESIKGKLTNEQPKWIAISVNRLFGNDDQFASLRHVKPEYVIGSTTRIFRLLPGTSPSQ